LTILLAETLPLFPFSHKVLGDVFSIESVFGIIQILLAYAVGALNTTFQEFTRFRLCTGTILSLFNGRGTTGTVLNAIDTDILVNHCASHHTICQCYEAAARFLAAVSWEKLSLNRADLTFLAGLLFPLSELFPIAVNAFVVSLLQFEALTQQMYTNYATRAIVCCRSCYEMVLICRLLIAGTDRGWGNDVDATHVREILRRSLASCRDVDYDSLRILKLFCDLIRMDYDETPFLGLLIPPQCQHWIDQMSRSQEQKGDAGTSEDIRQSIHDEEISLADDD
jgi:hypothetical protein